MGAEPMQSDLGLYDYLPWPGRPKITWPGGKKLADRRLSKLLK